METSLVYVRGTPGSGKTTLLNLLHQHILEKDPDAFVCVTRSWPPQGFHEQNSEALKAIFPNFPERRSLTFLLMDEAQESFEDSYLWNKSLKNIIDSRGSCYRVVVFCSYGHPSTPGKGCSQGTPTDVARAARMTLWPRKVESGEVSGLLLDWDEFNEVVSRFNKELVIDLDLSQKIFELTVGHVGAVCELLRLILDKMKTRIRREEAITVDTYYEEFSLEYIMRNLTESFTRGLPQSTELSDRPDVSDMFRRLLVYGRVTESSNDTAIQYCHRKGWIYAEDYDELGYGPQYYTFSSPLHYAALSWRLPQFETPYELSLQVLAKFKPSQMELPIRRIGGGSTDKPGFETLVFV
ncbi:hypothetical protein M378DRAFT_163026 [Amanita muscaria Koide BX008]|uniref:(+)RNA virus helicase C-terminal domain-containing protein n=1 Tax=Amanita muscaria (strain Koide BX008) TaxID=946122 RepID=A0A0C2X768_AMAMK|nr:hypothetical protein M378DRAFT_163026 [Amanita muscaria Koide BX008]